MKKNLINLVAILISTLSLGVALFSLMIASDSEKREKEIYATNISSILIANHRQDLGSLTFSTSEKGKLLQSGVFAFPGIFSLEPISFHLPHNTVSLHQIKRSLTKVLRGEANTLHKNDQKKYPPYV